MGHQLIAGSRRDGQTPVVYRFGDGPALAVCLTGGYNKWMNVPSRFKPIKIKICGITRLGDALSAIELGADLIGLNLVGGPRKITPAAAMQVAVHPVLSGKVVLLLDHWPQEWDAAAPPMDAIFGVQFYGPVDHPAIKEFRRRQLQLLLPVRVENARSLAAIDGQMAAAAEGNVIWLMDAHVPGQLGGTGRTFDWTAAKSFVQRLSVAGESRVGVAGGLTPHNVADAIAQLAPQLVDVSSGVEEPGNPGVKNVKLMAAFISAARRASQAASGGGEV